MGVYADCEVDEYKDWNNEGNGDEMSVKSFEVD